MKTVNILTDYLKESGVVTDLGGSDKITIKPDSTDVRLIKDLYTNLKFNNRLIVVMFVVLFILFALSCYLIIRFENKPQVITYLFGGSIFSVLTIVAFMRRIWLDKIQAETILSIVPHLTKDQKLKVIMAYLKKDIITPSQLPA